MTIAATALSLALALPLIEVPAAQPDPADDRFAVVLSGDGGWTSMDKELAEVLAEKGMPVIGLDSLSYFWDEKSPQILAKDLATVLDEYSKKFGKTHVVLVGYSFGADALPASIARLPRRWVDAADQIVLLAATEFQSFEIKILEWANLWFDRSHPLAGDVAKLDQTRLLCVYGKRDVESVCPTLKPPARVVGFDSGHRLDDHAADIAALILKSGPYGK